MSTEETLQAIRAINEQEEFIEGQIQKLEGNHGLEHSSIELSTGLYKHKYKITPAIADEIIDVVVKHYRNKKNELLEQAKKLIHERVI